MRLICTFLTGKQIIFTTEGLTFPRAAGVQDGFERPAMLALDSQGLELTDKIRAEAYSFAKAALNVRYAMFTINGECVYMRCAEPKETSHEQSSS